MYLRILPLVALTCLCRADEASRGIKEWSEELSATYAKHSGFMATYEFQGKGKSLSVTIAMDRSGEAVLHNKAIKDGQTMEDRFWLLGDTLFSSDNGKLYACTNAGEAVGKLKKIARELGLDLANANAAAYVLVPNFLLTPDGIIENVGLWKSGTPPWKFPISDATAVDADAREVVFHTPSYGDITVTRDSGMMVKQAIKGKEGEKRELILSSLQMNPGREAVMEIRRDWRTDDAKEMDMGMFVPHIPLLVFQSLISQVDRGEEPSEKLKEMLAAKSGYLRSLLRSYVDPWKDLSAEDQGQWKEIVEEAKKELGVKEQPDNPATKARLSDHLAKLPGQSSEELWTAIFDKGFDDLAKPATENGREARRLIVEAVARAYSEAEAEQRVEDLW